MKRKVGKYAGKRSSRFVALLSSLLLIVGITVGATIAYLTTESDEVVNTFTPSTVDITITENFDGNTKSNVAIKNEDVDGRGANAFIRVRVVDNWVDAAGNVLPAMPSGNGYTSPPIVYAETGWTKLGEFYYYNGIVKPNSSTTPLIDVATYTRPADATEARQIDILAEAIQANPMDAVEQTWGVTFNAEAEVNKWTTIPPVEGG